MAIKIHKNVPPPDTATTKYPFDEIGVGDMFHVPLDAGDAIEKLSKRVSSAVSMRRKRSHGVEEYVVQQVMDGEVLGIGVWRTS